MENKDLGRPSGQPAGGASPLSHSSVSQPVGAHQAQGGDYSSDAAFEKLMGSISRVYGLRPGHTLTHEDFDAIQHFDRHFREQDDDAIEAFHRGYAQGLREGGSADIEKMSERLSEKSVGLSVEKAMRTFAEDRLDEVERHVRDFIHALDKGFLDCKDDSAFIDALRTIADRGKAGAA